MQRRSVHWGAYIADARLDLSVRPTSDGKAHVELDGDKIGPDARSFWGHAYCHWLAGATASLTGWDVVTIEEPSTETASGWASVHTAALPPDRRPLDVFGSHNSVHALTARYREHHPQVRARQMRSSEIPGDVVRPSSDSTETVTHHAGSSTWWSDLAPSDDEELQAGFTGLALTHARLLCRQHGYSDALVDGGYAPAIDPANDHWPAAAAPVPAARTQPTTPPTTHASTGKPGGMMSIQDIRGGIAEVEHQTNTATHKLASTASDLTTAAQLLAQLADGSSAPELTDALGTLQSVVAEVEMLPSRLYAAVQAAESYATRL